MSISNRKNRLISPVDSLLTEEYDTRLNDRSYVGVVMTDDLFQLTEPASDELDEIKGSMPSASVMNSVADTFKILSDTTRVKILYALSVSELCVQDISALAGVSQSAVSHQLRILRNFRLVQWKKSGKQVFYSLDSEAVRLLIEKAMEHSLK